MGQVRSALAATILLLSIKPMVERKFLIYTFLVLIASGVQAFAFIALPAYWFYRIAKKSRYLVFIVLLVMYLLSSMKVVGNLFINYFLGFGFLSDILVVKLEGYSSKEGGNSFFSITSYIYLSIAFLLVYYRDKLHSLKHEFVGLSTYFIYGLILFYLFSGVGTFSWRSFDLFIGSTICILLTVPLYILNEKNKIFYLGFVFLLGFLTLYRDMSGFYKYQNILLN